MTILGRLFGWDRADEERAQPTGTLSEPPDWLWDALGAQRTYAGKRLGVEEAMRLVPVYSAVRLLSDSVRLLPLIVYRAGRVRATDHRLWGLLHDRANDEMPAGELWQVVTAHLNMRGNAYLYKERDRGGRVVALWPQNPALMRVHRVRGERVFELTIPDGEVFAGSARDFLHIRALATDGLVGLSPIQQARQALGTIAASEEYQGRMYANNARPAGVLETDKTLSDQAQVKLIKSWKAAHAGLENAAKVALLEDGVKWRSVGLSMDDQQFVEQQKLGVQQVARLFRVPASKLNAETGGSLTYSTTELEGIDYVTYSLAPWLATIEQSLRFDVDLPFDAGMYCEFLADALLRTDTKTRYESYEIGVRAGFLRRSEVRERENLPAIDGLDAEPIPSPTSSSGGSKSA